MVENINVGKVSDLFVRSYHHGHHGDWSRSGSDTDTGIGLQEIYRDDDKLR